MHLAEGVGNCSIAPLGEVLRSMRTLTAEESARQPRPESPPARVFLKLSHIRIETPARCPGAEPVGVQLRQERVLIDRGLVSEGLGECRVHARKVRFIEGQQPLPHEVVGCGGFMYIERHRCTNRSSKNHVNR